MWMSQNSCPALLYYMTEGWWLLRWGLGVVPAITYHCNAVPVLRSYFLSSFVEFRSAVQRRSRKCEKLRRPATGGRTTRDHSSALEPSAQVH